MGTVDILRYSKQYNQIRTSVKHTDICVGEVIRHPGRVRFRDCSPTKTGPRSHNRGSGQGTRGQRRARGQVLILGVLLCETVSHLCS